MNFATPYGPRHPVVVDATGPSLTKVSMQDECDVNRIVERFRATGLVTHLASGSPAFLDVSEVSDYRAAIDQVRAVGVFFDGLPAPLRSEFGNDPAAFMDFVADPANAREVDERFGGAVVPPVVAPVPPAPEPSSDGV